jgi:hypothetical protein
MEDCLLNPAHRSSLRDLISKNAPSKKAGGVAQVIEHLPSKHEALS